MFSTSSCACALSTSAAALPIGAPPPRPLPRSLPRPLRPPRPRPASLESSTTGAGCAVPAAASPLTSASGTVSPPRRREDHQPALGPPPQLQGCGWAAQANGDTEGSSDGADAGGDVSGFHDAPPHRHRRMPVAHAAHHHPRALLSNRARHLMYLLPHMCCCVHTVFTSTPIDAPVRPPAFVVLLPGYAGALRQHAAIGRSPARAVARRTSADAHTAALTTRRPHLAACSLPQVRVHVGAVLLAGRREYGPNARSHTIQLHASSNPQLSGEAARCTRPQVHKCGGERLGRHADAGKARCVRSPLPRRSRQCFRRSCLPP
jgi:hypothetical protein